MPPRHHPAATNPGTLQKLHTFISTDLLAQLPATIELEHAASSDPDFLPVRIHLGVFSSNAPRYTDCSAWLLFRRPTAHSRSSGDMPLIALHVHDEVRNTWAKAAANLPAELKYIGLDWEFWACESAAQIRTMARWYFLVLNDEAEDQFIADADYIPWSTGFGSEVRKMCRMYRRKKAEMNQLRTFKAPNVVERDASIESNGILHKSGAGRRHSQRGHTLLQTEVGVPSSRLHVRSCGPSREYSPSISVTSSEMQFSDTTDSDSGSSCRLSADPTICDKRMLNLSKTIEQHNNILLDIAQSKNLLEREAWNGRKYGPGTKEGAEYCEGLLVMLESRARASREAIRIFKEQQKWR